MNATRTMKLVAVLTAVVTLAGCAATQVALSKKDLVVQSKTSTAIFVEPVPREKRLVYVDVRSGVQEFDRRAFGKFVRDEFARNENGYRIVDDPDAAQYMLSIYVLNLEIADPTAAQAALNTGYQGETALAGAAGVLVGGRNGSGRSAAVGGLAGTALMAGGSLIANSLVKDVTYMLVCDVSVKERAAKGVLVRRDSQIDTRVSDAGSSQQRVSEVTDRKEYRTRVVTTANKANLKLEEAQDQLFNKTAYALSGFF
ncbi:MAG: complement resistance protein TraT [Burkholderiales bacterium]|nr:complement resistance protein TraT [Burkholderiales bacterium]